MSVRQPRKANGVALVSRPIPHAAFEHGNPPIDDFQPDAACPTLRQQCFRKVKTRHFKLSNPPSAQPTKCTLDSHRRPQYV